MAAVFTPTDFEITDGAGTKKAIKQQVGTRQRISGVLLTDATSASFTVPFSKVFSIIGFPGAIAANRPIFTPPTTIGGSGTIAVAAGLVDASYYNLEITGI